MMSIKTKISNFFKKYWQLLLGVVVAIIAFIVGAKREKNDLGDFSDNADSIIGNNVTEFRDRTGEVLRGIFSDRGHTTNPGESGGTDRADGAGTKDRILPTPESERPPDSIPTGTSQDMENSSTGISRDTDWGFNSTYPINSRDDGLLFHIEGPLLIKHGGHLFCLLAIMQFRYGRLEASQVVDIYNQGRKDPSIMDRFCVMGKKDYLLTYDAMEYLGADQYVIRCEKEQADYRIDEWNDSGAKAFRLHYQTKEVYTSPESGIKNFRFITSHYYRWV